MSVQLFFFVEFPFYVLVSQLTVLTIDIEYSFNTLTLPPTLQLDTILLDGQYEAFAQFSNVRNVSEFLDGSFVLQLANYTNTLNNINVPLAETIVKVDASQSDFEGSVSELFDAKVDIGETTRSGSR